MSQNTVIVFANPIAGRGRGRPIAQRLGNALTAAGFEAKLWLGPPVDFTADELGDGARAVVAVGGDGTVRGVAQRLYDVAGDAAPPLLIVPLGTANLLGRHLGIAWDDRHVGQQVVDAVVGGKVVAVDAGRANGRLFLLMVGVGFDAAVVHALTQVRKGPITMASYLLPAAMTMAEYRFPSIAVTVDGRQVFGGQGVVFVGNVKEYGTGFPMLPHARPDDGLLDVCCIPCADVQEGARMFLLAAAGEHLSAEGVVYAKGANVRVESPTSPKGLPIQIDGDAAGHTPVEIDLLPHRLRMIVP